MCSALALLLGGCGASGGDDDVMAGCGDGRLDTAAGELCDDGNRASGDGCGPRCLLEVAACGNGRTEAGETCDDGNTMAGDGCSGACLLEGAGVCGNGTQDGNEDCDDGNLVQTDECLNTCRNPRCGDGHIRMGMEDCDSGAANSNTASNACRLDCRAARCGDGVKDTGSPLNETCDDGNMTSNDGCSATCVREPRCGDAVIDMPAESCDDGNMTPGDGCSATCTREPRCGDGRVDSGEQCDDMNVLNGDGCSMTCQFEANHFYELEDNGTLATANVLPALGLRVHGAITAADSDWYKVTLTTPGDLRAVTTGPDNTTCTGAGDTEIQLIKEGGTGGFTVLATDDDAGDGLCSMIDPLPAPTGVKAAQRLPAGVYYIRVFGHSTATVVNDYRLTVTQLSTCSNSITEGTETCDDGNLSTGDTCTPLCLIEPTCGNRRIEPPEQCDDGAQATGDGCDGSCNYEFRAEVESNDTPATAQALGVVGPAGVLMKGAISPVNEQDFFSFTLSALSDVRIETLGELTPPACPAPLDLDLQLRAPDGFNVLMNETFGSIGNCSSIESNFDVAARRLKAGTYYVRVSGGLNMMYASYYLRIATTAVCGDRSKGSYEQCDDGNLVSGDGCSDLCVLDYPAATEVEPNDLFTSATALGEPERMATGVIESAGAFDFYSFTLTRPMTIAIDTFDADPARMTCLMTDTSLALLAADGSTVLVSDLDDGLDLCAKIDPAFSADANAVNLQPGTYYVRVSAAVAATAYQLVVRATARCGNSLKEGLELCDDGNASDGDGCTNLCTPPVLAESGPNDSIGGAQPIGALDRLITGAITSAAASDYYTFTTTRPINLHVESFDASPRRMTCTGLDTTLQLIAADGTTVLLTDPDDGIDLCSKFDPALTADVAVVGLAPGMYYLRISATAAASYQLVVRATALCGNGVREATEICDDGNATDADTCTNLCTPPLSSEIEPNDLFTSGTALTPPERLMSGTIEAVGAFDFYTLTLGGRSNEVYLETYDNSGRLSCATPLDTSVQLLATDGTTVVAMDDNLGLGNCSLLDPQSVAALRSLTPGTYHVRVGATAAAAAYRLLMRTSQCGNSVREGRELCDDGNVIETDACKMSCQPATQAEIEPNEDGTPGTGGTGTVGNDFSVVNAQGPFTTTSMVQAAISPAGDEDVFAIRNPGGTPATVDLITFENLDGSCPIVDTVVHVRDAFGISLGFDNDEGAGLCSKLTYAVPAATTVYAHVMRYNDFSVVGNYYFGVVFR